MIKKTQDDPRDICGKDEATDIGKLVINFEYGRTKPNI